MQFVWDDNDLKPREETVTLGQRQFLLKEASADVHRQYQNLIVSGARMEGEKVQFGRVADADLYLLAACLFEITSEKRGDQPAFVVHRAVSAEFARSLPNRVAEPLITAAKKMSNIGQQKPRQEKLETTFRETAGALAALAESPAETDSWKQWMIDAVAAAVSGTEATGPEDVAAKNGQPAGTSISV